MLERADRSLRYVDNPLLLANRKARCLASRLQDQPAMRRPNIHLPFIQAAVFLSSPNLRLDLEPLASANVYDYADTRVRLAATPPEIIRALATPHPRPAPPSGGTSHPRPGGASPTVSAPVEAAVKQALITIGVKRPNRAGRIGDYELVRLLQEGPGYRDFLARHTSVGLERRIRQYPTYNRPASQQALILRAASREFKVADSLRHPNILRAVELREHENGPALLYDYDPEALRLDYFMQDAGARCSIQQRLHLVRQIAEALAYAHSRRILHRALGPRSILVCQPRADTPTVLLMDWQTASREEASSSSTTRPARELVEDSSTLYMAPEALSTPDHLGEYSDVFSLGALTWFIFTGTPPASTRFELEDLLREHQGLQLSAVADGVPTNLDTLVQMSTTPNALERIQSVMEFLDYFADVEQKVAQPAEGDVDPFSASPGDALPGGFILKERLGQGGVALALLVEQDDREHVLKIAHSPEQNRALEQEAKVLRTLRDRHIVGLHDVIRIRDRVTLVLDRAGHETLAQRLERDGPLQLDLLQRFGSDLLDIMAYLEHKGVPHRDIKPANLGVARMGKNARLELVLFDFSLSRAPLEQIRAGTPHYLDPFLSRRRPPRWDLQAERYSVAVTLYEMATGLLPRWGDGISDPAMVECALVLEPECLEPALREPLTRFFHQALHREPNQRFEGAEEMKTAWKAAFDEAEESAAGVVDFETLLESCTPDTLVASLNLPPAQLQALDRLQVLTAADLTHLPLGALATMRGMSHAARRHLADFVARLKERMAREVRPVPVDTTRIFHGLDPIFEALLGSSASAISPEADAVRAALVDAAGASDTDQRWPASADLAVSLGLPQQWFEQVSTGFAIAGRGMHPWRACGRPLPTSWM